MRKRPAGNPQIPVYGMHAIFSAASTVLNVFISAFLIKAQADTVPVMVYFMVSGCLQPLGMYFACLVQNRFGPASAHRVFFLLYAALFAAIAFFGAEAARWYVLLGVVNAFANGFYYTPWNTDIATFLKDESLDRFTGTVTGIAYVANLLVPAVFGMILGAYTDFSGYRISFLIFAVLTLGALIFIARLPEEYHTPFGNTIRWGDTLKTAVRSRPVRSMLAVSFLQSVRGGVFLFLPSMLMYLIVSNEAVVGWNSTLSNLAGMLGAMLYAVLVRPRFRVRSVLFGTAATAAVAALLYWRFDSVTFVVFCAVGTLFAVFFDLPQSNTFYYILMNTKELRGHFGEMQPIRELVVAAGRVLGILLLLLLPGTRTGYVTAIILLTGVEALSAIVIAGAEKLSA